MDDSIILKGIADNQPLKDALQRTFEKQFDLSELSPNMSNENLGAMVRSRLDGLEKIKAAFKVIEKYKTRQTQPEKKNPGR